MTFPASVDTVTLTVGPLLDAGGLPRRGVPLTARLPRRVTILESGAVLATMVTDRTDDTGTASLVLVATALTADMQAMWTFLATTGAKIYQTTLTPYTTSSDSWATTANQTVTANESKRTGLNALIRTVPSPLTGILEIADLAETSRDSGKWKNDGTANKWTSDGIHPGTYGHTTMGTNATALIAATIT